jgi:surface protein
MESINMAKNDNLVHYLIDIANAIREKNGTSDPINAQDFADEIKNGGNSGGGGNTPKWTGHADAEGLRAIGWTDEDIAYYQEHGVNWNEEDDQYHLVSEDNKALYGVLTADNISTYKDRIVYLPKIDTSAEIFMHRTFQDCRSLVAIPKLNISGITSMISTFQNCYSLVCIPQLDTTHVSNMNSMFSNCRSLVSVPLLDTKNVTDMSYMFSGCISLVSIPQLNTAKVTNMGQMLQSCASLVSLPLLDTTNVTSMYQMMKGCYSLVSIPQLNTTNVTSMNQMLTSCYSLVCIPELDTTNVISMSYMLADCFSLTTANLKNVKISCQLNNSALLSKESLLYLINNEAATSAITIKLAAYAYTRLANDPDIVAALANHPNISIAQ